MIAVKIISSASKYGFPIFKLEKIWFDQELKLPTIVCHKLLMCILLDLINCDNLAQRDQELKFAVIACPNPAKFILRYYCSTPANIYKVVAGWTCLPAGRELFLMLLKFVIPGDKPGIYIDSRF